MNNALEKAREAITEKDIENAKEFCEKITVIQTVTINGIRKPDEVKRIFNTPENIDNVAHFIARIREKSTQEALAAIDAEKASGDVDVFRETCDIVNAIRSHHSGRFGTLAVFDMDTKKARSKLQQFAIEYHKRECGKQWASVKERLPDLKKKVLCISKKSKEPYVNNLCSDGYWFYENGFITHWQPLPEPPEVTE
jgi:head-tail adaptor